MKLITLLLCIGYAVRGALALIAMTIDAMNYRRQLATSVYTGTARGRTVLDSVKQDLYYGPFQIRPKKYLITMHISPKNPAFLDAWHVNVPLSEWTGQPSLHDRSGQIGPKADKYL